MRIVQSIAVALALIVGIGLSVPSQSAQPAPFTEAELDQMLAPVALYPDTVLSHVLIAATYPLEVVQAARWSRHNPSMRGEEAVAAVERQNWDPSVKALVAFPELLARMDEDLEWTQRLGDAFLMQEEEVVDTVQYLRSEAYAQGHLKSNDHVRVVRETQYIYIEPARTQVVYVPYYDPRVVYTRWRWSSHPPVYWHHPPAYRSSVVFYWGPAYRVAPSFYFSSFHWSRRQVVSVHHHHHHYHRHVHTHRHFSSGREIARHSSARHWQHNPTHRRGVSYRPGTDERRFVQQQRDNTRAASVRSASARASSPQRARTVNQQRQWAEQQRSSAPLRERAQARSQARSSGASASQRSDAVNRIQRDTGSSSPATARRASSARSEASAPRAAIRSEASTPRSAATRPENRVENRTRSSAPARAATTRPDSGARTATRATAAPRSEAARPQAQASAPASSQRQSPSATTRQAQAPRAAQSARQPQASSSPAVTRQSQPARAPRTQSSAPARSAPTAPRGNSSRSSAAPRASASAPSNRSGATTRSSNSRGGDSRRAARRVD